MGPLGAPPRPSPGLPKSQGAVWTVCGLEVSGSPWLHTSPAGRLPRPNQSAPLLKAPPGLGARGGWAWDWAPGTPESADRSGAASRPQGDPPPGRAWLPWQPRCSPLVPSWATPSPRDITPAPEAAGPQLAPPLELRAGPGIWKRREEAAGIGSKSSVGTPGAIRGGRDGPSRAS